jgi:hypothetical protein
MIAAALLAMIVQARLHVVAGGSPEVVSRARCSPLVVWLKQELNQPATRSIAEFLIIRSTRLP